MLPAGFAATGSASAVSRSAAVAVSPAASVGGGLLFFLAPGGWLGGRPLHSVTVGAAKGPLTSHTSTALPLETQLLLARGKGLTEEVEVLQQRIEQSKSAAARIRRVA